MQPFVTLFLLTSLPLLGQSISEPGSICGKVLNEKGEPASRVHVTAIYIGAHSGMYPAALTETSGHYCVKGVRPGEYVMSAEDPDKGYPNMQAMFYALHLPGPHVKVTTSVPEAHADWQIPYKAAILRIRLTDAGSGRQILPMFYKLTAQSRPAGLVRGSSASTMPILLPPNEDVLFTVTAPGYVEWPGDGSNGRLLNLPPGVTQELVIALRPAPR